LKIAIGSILFAAERKGIVLSEDLFIYGRIEKIEQEVAKSLVGLNQLEKKKIKEQMTNRLENAIVAHALLSDRLGNKKKFSVSKDELDAIIQYPWVGETYNETLNRKKNDTVGQIKRD